MLQDLVAFCEPGRDVISSDHGACSKQGRAEDEPHLAAFRSKRRGTGRHEGQRGLAAIGNRIAFPRKACQIFGAVQVTMSRMTWASAESSAAATVEGSLDATGTVPENKRPAMMRPLWPRIWAEISTVASPRAVSRSNRRILV